ncbi:YeaC family protein [Bowmanella sp. JS7-9]|uniref:YeaC family protein n=1 Tax=Pseudobowmanella zhangzhouensis TaxID=1537679 RepID=A0ABW1XJW0_9ALTE|nr:DUF1315 family protein [Bowmanella sp. JS7-9]TBX27345.1 hypothetical protein TK45_00920 [Bowmanella sp. JS7-9]
MQLEALLNHITPEVYERLCFASETGKWPNGEVLSAEQREQCLQAVMLYQARVMKSTEHMSVGESGEIVHKSKAQFKRELAEKNGQSAIARFGNDEL